MKASQILAGFELARRHSGKSDVKITFPADVLPFVMEIRDKNQEHFVCISLNGANKVIEKRVVTVGLLNANQVHPREIFSDAIAERAASIILVHNHPSGNTTLFNLFWLYRFTAEVAETAETKQPQLSACSFVLCGAVCGG